MGVAASASAAATTPATGVVVVVGAGNDNLCGRGLGLGHAEVANGTLDGLEGGGGRVDGVAALGLGLSLGIRGVVALLWLGLGSMRLLSRRGDAVGSGIWLGLLLLVLGWRGLLGVVRDLGDVRGGNGVLGQGGVGHLG